jgi:tetratricopeptide (TPR) repeat protein
MYLEDYRAAVEWLSGRDELFSLAFNSFIHVNHGFYMMNRSAEYVRILLPLLEQAKEREEEMIEKAEIALLSAATTSRHPLAGQIRAEMSAGFDDRPPDLQTRWLGHLGYSLFFSGEFDESIRFLESYVNRPENPIETGAAFNTLGNAYTMIGQYKKAEAYFDRSIALPGNPASKSLTRAKAGFPCLLDGRLKDALRRCLATIRFIDKNGVRIDGFYFATFPFWIPFTRLALDVGDLEFVAQMVASKKRRENLWNQNDPFDDLMDSYFYEAVADKVAPEMVERHQKLWTRGQMQPWLESLLDLSVDDFYGDHPHIPNGHLLPWNNG